MIFTWSEGAGGIIFEIQPEDTKEAAVLMRMSSQTNMSKVEVTTSFSSDVRASLFFRRKKGNAVPRTITNGKLRSR